PTRVYPSKVHIYKPCSLFTLQSGPSAAASAGEDVPSASAAVKHTKAEATASELVIIFVNVVFIVIVSFCLSFLVMAFFDSSSVPPSPRIRGLRRAKELSFLAVH